MCSKLNFSPKRAASVRVIRERTWSWTVAADGFGQGGCLGQSQRCYALMFSLLNKKAQVNMQMYQVLISNQ